MKELTIIQEKLKAPKGQYNSFGKYKYRSCEDILSAVKPLLAETACALTLSDDIVLVGQRIYVRATARLSNAKGETVETSAFAREDEQKKGMDGSQVTGAASSYARKYALNGMFAIDDTKEADSLNTSASYTAKSWAQEIAAAETKAQLADIYNRNIDLHDDPAFMGALTERKKRLTL